MEEGEAMINDSDLDRFQTNIIASFEGTGWLDDLFMLHNFNKNYLEKKLWGYKYNIVNNPVFSTDLCWAVKGGYTSEHFHQTKYNRIVCLFGHIQIEIGHKEQISRGPLAPSDDSRYFDIGPQFKIRNFDINPGKLHRLRFVENSVFIEIDSVRCLPDDIIRMDTGGVNRA